MLRTLDRYIIREVLPPSLVCLVLFTFTLEIQPVTNVAEPLIRRGIGSAVALKITALTAPQALALTIPMSLLCGVLVALGRLSADSEFRAMQACGIGITRLLRPILVLGVAFALASAYVGIAVAPAATTAFRAMVFNSLAAAGGDIQPRVFVGAFPHRTIFFRDESQGVWQDVFIADSSDARGPSVYLARRGRLQVDSKSRTLSIALDDGTRHATFRDKPGEYETTIFRRIVVYLDWESVFPSASLRRSLGELSVAELVAAKADRQSRGERTAEVSVELHRRFLVPVACVLLAVLGLAVGGTVAVTGAFGSFFIGVLIIFLYYVMLFTGRATVISGRAPAWLAMWYPNAVLAAAAIGLVIWRARGGVSIGVPFASTARKRLRVRAIVDRFAAWSGAGGAGSGGYTLDRYIIRLYLAVWALVFAALMILSYASVFTDVLTDLLRSSPSIGLAVPYLAYEFPIIAYYVIPAATLISPLIVIGLLTKTSEITAMKACGISVYRIAAPLVAVAAVIGVGLFGIQERLLPESTRRAEATRELIRGRPASSFRKLDRSWAIGRTGSIYHFERLDPERGELHGLSIFEFFPGEWLLRRRIAATTAINRAAPHGSVYEWTASDGEIWSFSVNGTPAFTGVFGSTVLRFDPAAYFKVDRPAADLMSYAEMSRYIHDLRAGGVNVGPYIVALYRKLSFPFVTIVMTLVAVPFAVTTGKRGAVHGIGIGIGLAFLYWTAMSVFGALGSAGAMPAILAAWAPNLIFGTGAAYLVLRMRT